MPAISLDKQISKNTLTLNFLSHVPILEITPLLAEDECVICKDSYRNNSWRIGGTLHRPVKLRCGHVLGFQCLARWMTTANPIARCPLCRVDLITPRSPPAMPERLRNILQASYARLETLAIVAGSGISQTQKKQLLSEQRADLLKYGLLWEFADGGDRVMAAWEELLNSMCKNESAATSRQIQTRQQPLAARTIARPAIDEARLVWSQSRIQIALYFSFMAMAYVISSPVWDYYSGRADTLTATVLSAWLWLGSAFVAHAVWRCDVWRKWEMVLFGVMSGVAFAGMVRIGEQLLHKWWMKGKYDVYTVYY